MSLGNKPAMEYQMVGENDHITEPEKVFYILFENRSDRAIIEIVSPTSKLKRFINIRQGVLDSFDVY